MSIVCVLCSAGLFPFTEFFTLAVLKLRHEYKAISL